MIKSFANTSTGKGLELFWTTGSKEGIRADMAPTIRKALRALDETPRVTDLRSRRLHRWKSRSAPWSIDVSGPVRLIFIWREEEGIGHAYEVDIWAH